MPSLSCEALSIIWDKDFLFPPETPVGEDTYVLHEINVNSVLPFPETALAPSDRTTGRRCPVQN